MSDFPAPIPEDRPLTAKESQLARWLLQHGDASGTSYLSQLDQAHVVSRCPCGCASIDFAVNGVTPPADAGMQILADFAWQAADGSQFGIFVFSRGELLAGLEVWSIDGLASPSILPRIDQLHPILCNPVQLHTVGGDGVQPGVDLTSNSAIEDVMDDESTEES